MSQFHIFGPSGRAKSEFSVDNVIVIGIDATNLRRGGGVTHLIELLRAAKPYALGVKKCIVWGGKETLRLIEDRPWLQKVTPAALNGNLFQRTLWQRFKLSKVARLAGCNLLFVPGGNYSGGFHPVVTMSRNLLPFEWKELRRYQFSLMTLKLILLRYSQSQTFRDADGIIFLTKHAKDTVNRVVGTAEDNTTIIPHGIDGRFFAPPREPRSLVYYSTSRPFRILYVSIVEMYKHQWIVAEAAAELWRRGFPIMLELVGPAYATALAKLKDVLGRIDPDGNFINYAGPIPYNDLAERYASANLFLFASSCENMPNILIEAMASGLPIACSKRGPMPEVLGSAGLYFNPEDSKDIAATVIRLIESPELRDRLAHAAFKRAQTYSWAKCAGETFSFLGKVATFYRHSC